MLAFGLCIAAPRLGTAQPQAEAPRTTPVAQPASPPAPLPAPVDVDDLPISISRIERQLARPSTITLQITRPMFRLGIIERRDKWFSEIEWLPEEDRRLPAPSGTAWNREFLEMVTPPTARPFGQSTGWDLLQLMSTSLVEGLTTKSLAQKIKTASARHRAAEASAEVDAAIEAWKAEQQHPVGPPSSKVPNGAVSASPESNAATPPSSFAAPSASPPR